MGRDAAPVSKCPKTSEKKLSYGLFWVCKPVLLAVTPSIAQICTYSLSARPRPPLKPLQKLVGKDY